MIPLLVSLSLDARLLPLSDCDRFMPLRAVNDAVRFHIERRYILALQLEVDPRNAAASACGCFAA